MLDLREATVRQRLSRARTLFVQLYTQESGNMLYGEERPASRSQMVPRRLRGQHVQHRSAARAVRTRAA